jgi:hypothetical protein
MTFPSPGLILKKPAALIVTLWTDYQPEFLSAGHRYVNLVMMPDAANADTSPVYGDGAAIIQA